MLLLIVLLTIVKTVSSGASNVGTTLFHRKTSHLDCWTNDEIALLKARKIFEEIIPPEPVPDKVDTKYIKNLITYFRRAIRTVEKEDDTLNVSLLKEALVDTIGGHLRRNILPTVRFAFYAGYIPYKHARNLHDFYDRITLMLNTKGYGWKAPTLLPEWSNLTVVKVVIGSGLFEPCSNLIVKRDKNRCIHFPKPKTDDFHEPSALLLPFKHRGLVGLRSPSSENIVVNYYTTAARCILERSTNSCRHADFVNFNNEIWHWMKREVAPRLTDEKLYAAYGGVLRVAAAVQSYGKGLCRRNLFDTEKHDKSWKIWKRFSVNEAQTKFDDRGTASFSLDILIVLGGTLFMYTILVIANALCTRCRCYDYLNSYYHGLPFNNIQNYGQGYYENCPERIVEMPTSPVCRGCLKTISECTCKPSKCKWGRLRLKNSKQMIAYSTVESNFPAMLPAPASPADGTGRREVSRGSTSASVKTRVYDLNENKEKEMEVILQETQLSESESETSGEAEYCQDTTLVIEEDVSSSRARRVPQLEAAMSQVRLARLARRSSGTTRSSVCTSSRARSWAAASCSDSGSSSSGRSSSPRWRPAPAADRPPWPRNPTTNRN